MFLLVGAGVILLDRQLNIASAITLATALVSLYWPLVTWLEQRQRCARPRVGRTRVPVPGSARRSRPGGRGRVPAAPDQGSGVRQRHPARAGHRQMLLQDVSLLDPGRPAHGAGGGRRHGKTRPGLSDPALSRPDRRRDPHRRQNLRWVTLDSLRAQIAMVLQHNLVFNDTVANNIGCGDPSFTLPQIIEAAKIAHAHQFIQKLPQGYETPIGETGPLAARSASSSASPWRGPSCATRPCSSSRSRESA